MEGLEDLEAKRQFYRFCRQYLQLHLNIDFPDPEYLRKDGFQQAIYKSLFKENALEHFPPQRYQLRVLKELTRRIEESIQDWENEGLSDDIMSAFSCSFAAPLPSEASAVQQKSYVTYSLSLLPLQQGKTPSITLLESRNLLAAAGTTGLRTWEAALLLGDYLCSNPHIIQGQTVLELGAGSGYVSILCAKHLGAAHVIATDGSDDVVAGLSTNFYINGLQENATIESKELRWGQALVGSEHPEWNNGRTIDVVLGADVTYDGGGILALLSTFGDLFEFSPNLEIFISATIRNKETTQKFLTGCKLAKYSTNIVNFPVTPAGEQGGPFYSDQVPIEIFHVTRQ